MGKRFGTRMQYLVLAFALWVIGYAIYLAYIGVETNR